MHDARPHRRAALALMLALVALSLGAGAAVANAPAGFTVGDVPPLRAGSVQLGALSGSTPLTLDVQLTPRNPEALAALATAVSTPGSPQYHRYLDVGQFAARFGAAPSSVAAVRAALRSSGLYVGPLAANGLSLQATGDAAAASAAFSVSLRRWREPDGHTVFANTSVPRLPPALQDAVASVSGLDDVPTAVPANLVAARSLQRAQAVLSPQSGSGTASACFSRSSAPWWVMQVAGAYSTASLWNVGDLGSGVTIALYELEPYSASDILAFQSCVGTSAQITNIEVGAGPGTPGPGSGETALDIENLIGIAPAAHIDVYQGQNGPGTISTLAQIVSDDAAQVISDSWGLCEPQAGGPTMNSEQTLLEEAATQGQTFLVASGDDGSNACGDQPSQDTVNDTASQQWATAVGGTSLSNLSSPGAQTVWNNANGASGGGVSVQWTMPSWQTGSGVIEPGHSSGSPCGAGAGLYCREVPDISADADPLTGYVVYWDGGWVGIGGTSAAAPLWAGLVALADASGEGGCASSSLGFLNPNLYSIAAGATASSALTDVTSGNNGSYPAGAGYDMTTGLGTPIAGGTNGLVAQLCAAASSGGGTAPAVSGLSAPDAPPGAVETISGSGFSSGASVAFGSTAAGSVTFVDSQHLRASVPAGNGVVDVRVSTGGGTSAVNGADRFTYAPTAAISTPAPSAVYTQTQVVNAQFSCASSTSGTGTCVAPVAQGAPIDTTTIGVHTFSVTATDANGVQGSASVPYDVVAPPSSTISVPAAGARYARGASVTANYTCAASAPLALTGCTGPVASGAAIDTSALGQHTFTVIATDTNGVAATVTSTYDVVAPPSIGGLRQSAGRWLEHTAHGVHLPIGTSFAFTLDQRATVTLRFTRLVSGRLAGSACRAGAPHGKRCTARVGAGSISNALGAGVHALRFVGTTSAGRLAPGAYVVSVSASGPGGKSAVQTLRFTIAKP